MKVRCCLLVMPVALALVAGGVPGAAGAAPVLCQKKSGVIAVRDPACKKREMPLDLAQFGAGGLFAHTQNVESTWPITSSPTVVAIIGDPAPYSGSSTTPLVQPDATSYMAVSVQAHVADVSGVGVACALEARADAGAWAELAATAVPSSEGFLSASFPSFVAGTSWSFRVVCQTGGGDGTARGEIGAVAGVIN